LQENAQFGIDSVIRTLDVMIAVGRYILPISIAVALLAAAAALNSIATDNIAAALFWFFMASISGIFALQIVLKRRARRKRSGVKRVRRQVPRVAQA
jgi:hypothetical protein